MFAKFLSTSLIATAVFALQVGCSSQDAPQDSAERDQPIEMTGPPPLLEDEHQGPHGGHVIELGRSHEFHAELMENEEARTVSVYILGKDMQELALGQPTISLSLIVEGKPQSFVLQAADPTDGKASRFEATDSEAFAALHEHEATGKLLVSIDGKSYSGAIEHHDRDHGHEGEDHDHDH